MARGAKFTLKDYRALAGIRRGMRQFLEFSAEAARSAGLTPAQHQALLAIKGMTGPVTVGTLAAWLGIRHHSAVGLVDRLAKAKLVIRIPDPQDRRRMCLNLTPRADAKLAALSQVHRAELRRFSAALAPLLDILR
ncbi:MAG: MarR family transcriptional regulator [Alphaproteobacteria bacterium]|nr:MarR family transcriptional regulator [Alphaproteobacteria bacterium]